MAWALAGAALAMLCLHIVRLPRQGTPVQSGAPQDEAVALVRSTTPNGETAEVFQETRRLFPSNLRWVADTNQQFLVDVAETTGSSSTRSSNGFAHVSLVAVARTPGKSWQVLWKTVVYTQGGEYATVPVPGGQATIWAHPADSSVVAVETQLSLLGVSTTASRLLTAGDCAPLIVQQTAEREFRVYQTAQSVDDLPQT
jgi:hypothetical protein